MPIIQKRPTLILKSVTVKLEQGLALRLKEYATFMNMQQSEIVAAAVAHVIAADREFSVAATISVPRARKGKSTTAAA